MVAITATEAVAPLLHNDRPNLSEHSVAPLTMEIVLLLVLLVRRHYGAVMLGIAPGWIGITMA